MGLLEEALYWAIVAHEDKKDKANNPYILHPLRVMIRMDTDIERMVAVMHDVLEGSEVDEVDLRDCEFPEEVIDAVKCLTRSKDEPYLDYIKRVNLNPLARKIKLADLEDNMDLRRINSATINDFRRVRKYGYCWRFLRGEIPEILDATITVAAPLRFAHAEDAQVSGSGITLATSLSQVHNSGTPVANSVPTPGAPNQYYR